MTSGTIHHEWQIFQAGLLEGAFALDGQSLDYRLLEGQRDVAVQIQGVWVRPGDWLYADEDGIVVSATPLLG